MKTKRKSPRKYKREKFPFKVMRGSRKKQLDEAEAALAKTYKKAQAGTPLPKTDVPHLERAVALFGLMRARNLELRKIVIALNAKVTKLSRLYLKVATPGTLLTDVEPSPEEIAESQT